MSILGKLMVIMADQPWDIHMELPYGTMSDDEMRKLAVPSLQDDGFIFLWVTGRSVICICTPSFAHIVCLGFYVFSNEFNIVMIPTCTTASLDHPVGMLECHAVGTRYKIYSDLSLSYPSMRIT